MGILQRYQQANAIRYRENSIVLLRTKILKDISGTQLAKDLLELALKPPTYTLEGASHVRMNLHALPDGTYAAWARGPDGRFIGQATLRPEFNAAQLVGVGSAAILYICMNQIAKELRTIGVQLDKLQSAIEDNANKAFQQALAYAVEALDRRDRYQLQLAELPLRQTLAQQAAALVRELHALPKVGEGLWVNVGFRSDKTSEISRGMLAQETRLQSVFVGFSTLIEMRRWLDGRAASQRALSSFDLDELLQALRHAEALGGRVAARIETKKPKSLGTTEIDSSTLATPWAHAAGAIDQGKRQLRLKELGFGRQSTLITIPCHEITTAFAPAVAR